MIRKLSVEVNWKTDWSGFEIMWLFEMAAMPLPLWFGDCIPGNSLGWYINEPLYLRYELNASQLLGVKDSDFHVSFFLRFLLNVPIIELMASFECSGTLLLIWSMKPLK